MLRRASVVAFLVLAGACATVPGPDPRFQKLSPESQALFARYHQFLTEEQVEGFYAQTSDIARQQYIDALKIEERVERYPKPIQDAIWTQTPVVGMDKPALFLAVGRPDAMDHEDDDALAQQKPREIWRYRRAGGQDWWVTLVDGVVTEVKAPRDEKLR